MEIQKYNRQQIILTADDFGLNQKANQNILELVSLGKIQRVAVMPYGQISATEVNQLLKSQVKLDIHLDILHQFEPTETKKRSGAIGRGLEFLFKLTTGELSLKKIETDWEKQILTFQQIFGRKPDGLNSHEHIHLFPPFFKLALKLKAKHEIPYIRFGDSIFMPHHNLVSYILHTLRKINLKTCTQNNCVSSGWLVSLDWIKNVNNFLAKLPEGTTEIACHPELAIDLAKIKKYF